ncbi:MAG: HAD-IIIA family hydrolase [Tunicatimonas sp.]|uniref:KdsC family phosphatase n=1 Tax=Tunicatimonas sp. TaxID=1940096 RepID=UPI003C760935
MNIDPSKIRLLVLDVDGTLTDGGIYITDKGDAFKKYNAKDGMAIKRLNRQGMPVAFISASHSAKNVEHRAQMLGVEYCYVGSEPKTQILEGWMKTLGIQYSEVLFMGDDINDREVMQKVGVSACPADASPAIREIADIVLERRGGDACFRELVDRYFPIS